MRRGHRRLEAGRAAMAGLLTIAAACGGSGGEGSSSEGGGRDDPAVAATPASEAERLIALESFPDPPDPALADLGAQLYQQKGCIACHTIGGGRLVGPDLTGVTARRTPGWIAAQILNPDSMIRNDPVTRELFAEYMTPMSNQGLTVEDVRAVLEYLRRDAGGD